MFRILLLCPELNSNAATCKVYARSCCRLRWRVHTQPHQCTNPECVCLCMRACVHACVLACVHLCMHACICVYMCAHVCTCACVCVCLCAVFVTDQHNVLICRWLIWLGKEMQALASLWAIALVGCGQRKRNQQTVVMLSWKLLLYKLIIGVAEKNWRLSSTEPTQLWLCTQALI